MTLRDRARSREIRSVYRIRRRLRETGHAGRNQPRCRPAGERPPRALESPPVERVPDRATQLAVVAEDRARRVELEPSDGEQRLDAEASAVHTVTGGEIGGVGRCTDVECTGLD